jgi:two-component system, NarL family, sensor histidine kinase UhpB
MIKYSCLIIFISFIAAFQLKAQTFNQDSLLKELPKAKEDSSKTFLLRNIGATYYNQDPRKAIAYWRQAVELSYKLNYVKGLAINYINISLGYSFLSKMDSSVIYIDSAIKYSKIIGEPDRLALAYLNKADAYRNLGNFTAALLYCDTASVYAAKKNNTDRLARIYDIISGIYFEQKQYHASLGIQAKALAMYKKDGNEVMEGQVYDDFGLLYEKMGKTDSALHYYKKAVAFGERLKDYKNLSSYYGSMAHVHAGLGKYREAETYANKALEYGIQQENNNQLASVYSLLGEIYFKQEKFADAAKAGEKAYSYSLDEVIPQQQQIAFSLSEAYNMLGDHKNAYKYLTISNTLKDSITKETYNEQVASLKASFELKEKDKEIVLLGKDKELQQQKLFRQRILFAAAAVLLAIALAGIWFLLNRSKLKQRMKELELRNQIAADLHDEVGSSLSSIHMLSQMANTNLENDRQKNILDKVSTNAKETMDRMSDIVWMIKPGETEAGSLQQRMERFAYEICSSRNIQLQIQVAEIEKLKLSMEQRKNIYLIFKEAVNNAVKYSGTQKIEATAFVQNRQLALTVKDFGKGLDRGVIKKGNGLDNMQHRAKELGGELIIDSSVNEYTTVKLSLGV